MVTVWARAPLLTTAAVVTSSAQVMRPCGNAACSYSYSEENLKPNMVAAPDLGWMASSALSQLIVVGSRLARVPYHLFEEMVDKL